MLNPKGQTRLWMTAGLLLGSTVLLRSLSHGERVPIHRPLDELPSLMEGWHGSDDPFPERIIKAAGVDDYLNRAYVDAQGSTVELYVGYYQSQRTGDTIHSPKNCLPGAGWEPTSSLRKTIRISSRVSIPVNEYVIQKGLDKMVVIYWYQSQGRVVASEYWGKFWMIADALTRNRTDGSLVRLTTPGGDDLPVATDRVERFAREVYPRLCQILPN